ncbi:MAG: sulfurtransferase-like selenium metabolism protein YedF [Syntrophobacteraceae bacterium]
MSEQLLDCRGQACPGPVLKAKEVLDHGNVAKLSILVDNPAAKENVSRFLSRMGYEIGFLEEGGDFKVTGTRDLSACGCEIMEEFKKEDVENRIAVIVGTDRMGKGDDTLGQKLLKSFIGTLKEMGHELWRLILLNGGVKLTVEGSECLTELQALQQEGISILVCGTCLGHFGLLEKKQVGETTNMLDIVTAMQTADKVVSIM